MTSNAEQRAPHAAVQATTQTLANLELRALVVTRVDQELRPVIQERSLDALLQTLCGRAKRLVEDRRACQQLRELFRLFIHNVVDFFRSRRMLDQYTLTNLATALACADDCGMGHTGLEDYCTLIRRLNPTEPGSDGCFIFGREGKIGDPDCPIGANGWAALRHFSKARQHMYLAFYHARSMDVTRGAPRIQVDDFFGLIPRAITTNPNLEEAFLDVCFSDGAWELYQRSYERIIPC